MTTDNGKLTITPLGGLGEIGLNCTAFSTKDHMVLVDCGLMFPEDYLFGVDVVIPCFDFILDNREKIKAIVLTHGHEDHIGALPWLLYELRVPVYGSPFTLGLVREKLKEHDLDYVPRLREVQPLQRVELGDMAFNFFPVCHSIIQGYALGMETPVGKILHTGDFKIDRYPLGGHSTDLESIADFCRSGVKLMMSDSTNVEREGFALTEREIKSSFNDIFIQAESRILITLFSSHIQRIQEIIDLAKKFGRKVGISGKSLHRNVELASDMGLLHIPPGTLLSLDELQHTADAEVVLLVTGSQGEPLAALSRMSMGEHRQLSIHQGDLVIMSSRFIPGNVKAITKVINQLYKLGAEVVYERVQAIHASGHAHREELKMMLETVNPEYFIPVHGEYRHLVKHSRLAVETGVAPEKAVVLEDGQPLTIYPDRIRRDKSLDANPIFVDGKGVGDVGRSVLKERRLLAGEGLVIALLVIDEITGEITLGPDLVSKGFIFEQQYAHLLDDAKSIILDIYDNVPFRKTGKLEDRIRSSLRRFFRKALDRDPVVVPLVICL